MDDKRIVHDLAMVYARERYQKYCTESVNAKTRSAVNDMEELFSYYYDAVQYLVDHYEQLDRVFKDDEGQRVF